MIYVMAAQPVLPRSSDRNFRSCQSGIPHTWHEWKKKNCTSSKFQNRTLCVIDTARDVIRQIKIFHVVLLWTSALWRHLWKKQKCSMFFFLLWLLVAAAFIFRNRAKAIKFAPFWNLSEFIEKLFHFLGCCHPYR